MNDHRSRAQAHLVPHFTKAAAWRSENLAVIDRGEGCYIWDTDGNKYLDGLAGLFCTNIGHGRSDLTAAAAKQMDQLAFLRSLHPLPAITIPYTPNCLFGLCYVVLCVLSNFSKSFGGGGKAALVADWITAQTKSPGQPR